MRKESLEFLKSIVNKPLPSGYERGAQDVWMNYAKPIADETKYDAYGNAIAILNPKGSPRLMVIGHCDAIGGIISYINDQGYLYFVQVGGIDPLVLISQRVVIHSEKGPVTGAIGRKAVHMTLPEDRVKAPKNDELWIDIGAKDKKDAEKYVSVGDYVSLDGIYADLKNNNAVGCKFDNKVGTWSAIETLRLLKGIKMDACVIAVSGVQEENTGVGATTAAYHLEPDVCIAVDVTHATDHPGCSKEKFCDVKLGDGPAIEYGPAIHPVVIKGIVASAKKARVKLQVSVDGGRTGTDLDSVFKTRGGIPSALVQLPNRYMHSSVEVINLNDLESIPKVIAEYAKSLKKTTKFY
jgi:putative aminopeptidase FrvX